MSYSKPTIVRDNISEVTSGLKAIGEQQFAREQQQRQQNIGTAIQAGMTIAQSILPKKQALKDFTKGEKKRQQDLYDKVGTYSTGYDAYDANSEAFFHDLISKNNEIQYALNNNQMIDSELGKKDLANIQNLVNMYGEAVPNILATANAIEKSMEPGARKLSVTGAPVPQLNIIRKIANGDDIKILQEGSTIMLYDPETKEKLNIREFNKAIANNKENPYLKYEADIKEPLEKAFNNRTKDTEGNFNTNYVTNKKVKTAGGQEVEVPTMSIQQQDQLKDVLKGPINKNTGLPNGQFTKLIELEGESIWEDESNMNNDTQWLGPLEPGDDGYEEYKKQYNTMLDYLADKSVTDNANQNGIELDIATEDQDSNLETEVKDGEEVATTTPPEEVEETEEENEVVEEETEQVTEADSDIDDIFGAEETTERDLKAENKKQEDLMRNSEVEYGGKSGDNTVGLPSYKDFDFGIYLNSSDQLMTEQVDEKGNKIPATYGKSGQPKKGLKTDLGEDVYNGLSEGQQAMMRMQHLNIPWDPRVVMLISTDVIPRSKRREYLEDWEATTELYNENKEKFKSIDDQKMFDEWVDIYANTEPNEKGFQKQYKRRAEDMAKAYGYKLTDEQKKKFKI